jgi:hypothetical protein
MLILRYDENLNHYQQDSDGIGVIVDTLYFDLRFLSRLGLPGLPPLRLLVISHLIFVILMPYCPSFLVLRSIPIRGLA